MAQGQVSISCGSWFGSAPDASKMQEAAYRARGWGGIWLLEEGCPDLLLAARFNAYQSRARSWPHHHVASTKTRSLVPSCSSCYILQPRPFLDKPTCDSENWSQATRLQDSCSLEYVSVRAGLRW